MEVKYTSVTAQRTERGREAHCEGLTSHVTWPDAGFLGDRDKVKVCTAHLTAVTNDEIQRCS